MFYQRPKDEKSGLEKTIDTVFSEMSKVSCDSEEFSKMNAELSKLYSLKEIDAPKRISRDKMLEVFGYVLGIVIIVGYERTHVLTSKALTARPPSS